MTSQNFLKEHQEFGDIELTDDESEKLRGMPSPGATIEIHWNNADKTIDAGYLFLLPFSDMEIDDYFVHIPKPDNPGGKENAEPEWAHINKLLKNELVKKIVVTNSKN